MPKAKKTVAPNTKASARPVAKPAARAKKPSTPKAPAPPRRASSRTKGAGTEPSVPEAQVQVVASKFAPRKPQVARRLPRPPLPSSYGESHLLLLARDPQTLFAAWDMAPSSVDAIRNRIGKRAFEVSTLTLRLTRAGGPTSVVHVSRKSRSRYLKIEGGPSFMAEIGFTTPAGRFELLSRSAPCFTPMGAPGRHALLGGATPTILSYREARARARRGQGSLASIAATAAARAEILRATEGQPQPTEGRTIGGASDLYRR